jgi:hypothetical protein
MAAKDLLQLKLFNNQVLDDLTKDPPYDPWTAFLQETSGHTFTATPLKTNNSKKRIKKSNGRLPT